MIRHEFFFDLKQLGESPIAVVPIYVAGQKATNGVLEEHKHLLMRGLKDFFFLWNNDYQFEANTAEEGREPYKECWISNWLSKAMYELAVTTNMNLFRNWKEVFSEALHYHKSKAIHEKVPLKQRDLDFAAELMDFLGTLK